MSTQNLIRWSGLALVVGGIGIALFLITLYPLGSFFDPQVLTNSQSMLAHTFHWIGAAFALFGLVGWYAVLRAKSGALAFISFVLAFIGTAIQITGGIVAGDVFPRFASEIPDLFNPGSPVFTSLPISLGVLGFGIGYVLLGISTLRARVLPRGGAILAIIGAALFMLPPQPLGPFPTVLTLLGAVLWGAGAAWIGFALWSSKSEMTV